MELQWWSIEVADGAFPAEQWRTAHGESLIEAGITRGMQSWWFRHASWGMIFEVAFADEAAWTEFRQIPAVIAALDAVPDPINGLFIHPGQGGSTGSSEPRRPRPPLGAGAAPLPVEPDPLIRQSLAGTELLAGR